MDNIALGPVEINDWVPDTAEVQDFHHELKRTPMWKDLSDKRNILDRMEPWDDEELGYRNKKYDNNNGDIEKIISVIDNYYDHEEFTYDFVVVLKIVSPTDNISELREFEMVKECCRITTLLSFAGLKLKTYKSVQQDELYVLIGATEDRLKKQARMAEFDLELDPDELFRTGSQMKPPLHLMKEIESQTNPKSRKFTTDAKLTGLFVRYYAISTEDQDNQWKEKLYKQQNENYDIFHVKSIFTHTQRLKLTKMIITADTEKGGSNLKLESAVNNPTSNVLAFFPLHSPMKKKNLIEKCKKWGIVFAPPHKELHEYFGEEVSMYFHFLSFYTKWLLPVAFLGLAVVILQIYKRSLDVILNIPFGLVMMIWATIFLNAWKREQKKLSTKWGTHRFSTKEPSRPEFLGDMRPSPVTGKFEGYVSPYIQAKRFILSYLIVGVFVLSVIMSVQGTFYFRKKLIMTKGSTSISWAIIPACINAIFIITFNAIFSPVARYLNHFENHRTETDFENSLITKVFFFKFFNSYYSLLHIAFAKRFLPSLGYCHGSYLSTVITLEANHKDSWFKRLVPGGKFYHQKPSIMDWVKKNGLENKPCGDAWMGLIKHSQTQSSVCHAWDLIKDPSKGWDYRGDCFFELSLQLGVLFLVFIFLENIVEIGIPTLWQCIQNIMQGTYKNEEEKVLHMTDQEVSIPEKEYIQEQYERTFSDYDEIVVQFGYVLLFVISFPAAPFLALLGNLLEFRIDALKMLQLTRRPYPRSVENIGAWFLALNVVNYLSSVTNMLLLTIMPSVLLPKGEITLLNRVVIFIFSEHLLVLGKMIASWLIPELPEHVHHHRERENYIKQVLLSK